jgi:hypothetical protein
MLLDSGASISAVKYSTFTKLMGPLKFRPLYKGVSPVITDAGGKQLNTLGCYKIPFITHDTRFCHPFHVIKNLANDFIAGIDFIHDNGLIINGRTKQIDIPAPDSLLPDGLLHTIHAVTIPAYGTSSVMTRIHGSFSDTSGLVIPLEHPNHEAECVRYFI